MFATCFTLTTVCASVAAAASGPRLQVEIVGSTTGPGFYRFFLKKCFCLNCNQSSTILFHPL